MVVLYHYTTLGGLEGIKQSGYIQQTQAWNAGGLQRRTGVYLTKLDPCNYTKQQLIHNNYRAFNNYKIERVACYVKVWLPRGNNLEKEEMEDGRDIWIYLGGVLELSEVRHQFGTVDSEDNRKDNEMRVFAELERQRREREAIERRVIEDKVRRLRLEMEKKERMKKKEDLRSMITIIQLSKIKLDQLIVRLEDECQPQGCRSMTTHRGIARCTVCKQHCSAKDYMHHTLDWAQAVLLGFTGTIDVEETWKKLRTISRRFYRILSHAYLRHRDSLVLFEKKTLLWQRFNALVIKHDLIPKDYLLSPTLHMETVSMDNLEIRMKKINI